MCHQLRSLLACLQGPQQPLLKALVVMALLVLAQAYRRWKTSSMRRPLWFSTWLGWHPCWLHPQH
jgi:hypothetical protein